MEPNYWRPGAGEELIFLIKKNSAVSLEDARMKKTSIETYGISYSPSVIV